eukprot:scaffold80998_cov61-Phaeocystis_antarctica.AAC.3
MHTCTCTHAHAHAHALVHGIHTVAAHLALLAQPLHRRAARRATQARRAVTTNQAGKQAGDGRDGRGVHVAGGRAAVRTAELEQGRGAARSLERMAGGACAWVEARVRPQPPEGGVGVCVGGGERGEQPWWPVAAGPWWRVSQQGVPRGERPPRKARKGGGREASQVPPHCDPLS